MKQIEFKLIAVLDDDGTVDRVAIQDNINDLLNRGFAEGVITPDDDDHAGLLDIMAVTAD